MHAAEAAFPAWSRTTPGERQHALLKLADLLEANADAIADAEVGETGKIRSVVLDEEIPQCADQIRFFAGAARALGTAAAGEYLAGHTSYQRREAVGVIAQITPWNYPLMMAVWKIAPALAAGNTVVLKPADTTPSSTVLLAQLAAEVLPAGVFNVVLGDRDTGRLLVEHPVPAMVSITGSTRAGIEVARSAAATVKRTHLELGGNAPVLVFDDVDVAAAADGIVGAAFYNAGQDCTAASRVLVHSAVHDEFVAALTKAASAQVPGTDFGPLNSQVPARPRARHGRPFRRDRPLWRQAARLRRLLPGAHGDLGARAVRRAGAGRGVRAGDHRAVVRFRRRGRRAGQRRSAGARVLGLDP